MHYRKNWKSQHFYRRKLRTFPSSIQEISTINILMSVLQHIQKIDMYVCVYISQTHAHISTQTLACIPHLCIYVYIDRCISRYKYGNIFISERIQTLSILLVFYSIRLRACRISHKRTRKTPWLFMNY